MTSIGKARLPSAAIAIPLPVAAGLAVFATATLGVIAGVLIGFGAALASVTHRIAHGDRYAILPRQTPGPLAAIARSVDGLRSAVLEADALAVDQRRREAESRLHMASRSFFTRSFRAPSTT